MLLSVFVKGSESKPFYIGPSLPSLTTECDTDIYIAINSQPAPADELKVRAGQTLIPAQARKDGRLVLLTQKTIPGIDATPRDALKLCTTI